MSRRDYACRIVEDLCGEMGLAGLRSDAQGRLSLTFDDILVTFVHRHEPLEATAIFVDLGAVAAADAKVPGILLELNFQTWLARNMTIGLDPESNRAVGWNVIPVDHLNTHTLREAVQAMLTTARALREALGRPEIADGPKEDVEASPRFGHGMMRV